MFTRHVTPTRVVLSVAGLLVAAAVASQIAFSFKLPLATAFGIVLLAAVGAGVTFILCRRAGAWAALRLGRDPEAGRQAGGMLAGLIVTAIALSRTLF